MNKVITAVVNLLAICLIALCIRQAWEEEKKKEEEKKEK